ncbi:uncharacterized protein si:ch73-204p21.2 [Carassius carassius]|uniref:uncharacterized protein si:ch73-204p21.2 n=1 Tax=Carassius carassius TaxID=217509 RepID=UPI0028687078|nr:uncharacterized protein si:ch73-204p21.2 [Carassius carassius]XP_059376062.1 uncharacterized protein si:ch73-204p21.2 [Carassius carassius]XP_059376063.1 uncharacterized protein si:ch73-204p21.2 [Carassius carassius]
MAPIGTDLVGWAVTEQPEAAFLSIVVLFIVSIALLVLCASCKKHSFELDSHSIPEQQKTSTLVSVAKMNDSRGARQNPADNDITEDEIGLEAVEGEGEYRPWRSHTLTQGSSLQPQINGGIGTTTEGSVTLQTL